MCNDGIEDVGLVGGHDEAIPVNSDDRNVQKQREE
jgi:hypothetical protein